MGFAQALADLRAAGWRAEADRAEMALGTFRGGHGRLYDALDSDPNISDSVRQELPKQLQTAVVNDGQVVINRLQAFCRAHQCAGSAELAAANAVLGHAIDRHAFEGVLASARRPTGGFRRRGRHPGPWVAQILRQGLGTQKRDLAHVSLRLHLMWSFYDTGCPETPFAQLGKQPGELVRCLGLGQVRRGAELLIWAHRLVPRQTAHVPTVLDADLNESFQPGGRTMPLTGTGAMNEVVHYPVTGAHLEEPIASAGLLGGLHDD